MSRSVGNQTTIGFGSNGTPLASSSAPLGMPTVGKMGVTQTGQGVFMESLGKTRAPGGVDVPVAVRKKIPNAVIGKALFKGAVRGAAAGGGAGVLWGVGSALYDIWGDLGYNVVDGKISKPQTAIGGAYKVPASDSNADVAYMYATWLSACTSTYGAGCSVWVKPIPSGTGDYCNGYKSGPGTCFAMQGPLAAVFNGYTTALLWRPTAVYTPGYVETTEQQFLDDIATKSGWPSKASQAFADAIQYPEISIEVEDSLSDNPYADIMPKLGINWDTGTTGPQTVGQPKVSQKNSTNSSGHPIVEQKVEETKATVEDGKIIYNTTTITNIYNETTNTTETTTEEKPAEDTEKCKDGDTTLGCASTDVPEGEIPKRTVELEFDDTNLFGMGSCPADVQVTIAGQQRTAVDFSGTVCPMVETYVRPLVIALATFMAFVILVPGAKPE